MGRGWSGGKVLKTHRLRLSCSHEGRAIEAKVPVMVAGQGLEACHVSHSPLLSFTKYMLENLT